jgi:hypothetical protein
MQTKTISPTILGFREISLVEMILLLISILARGIRNQVKFDLPILVVQSGGVLDHRNT